jgi:hypothetical protein
MKYRATAELLTLSTPAILLTRQSRPKWTIHSRNKSLSFCPEARHEYGKMVAEGTNATVIAPIFYREE